MWQQVFIAQAFGSTGGCWQDGFADPGWASAHVCSLPGCQLADQLTGWEITFAQAHMSLILCLASLSMFPWRWQKSKRTNFTVQAHCKRLLMEHLLISHKSRANVGTWMIESSNLEWDGSPCPWLSSKRMDKRKSEELETVCNISQQTMDGSKEQLSDSWLSGIWTSFLCVRYSPLQWAWWEAGPISSKKSEKTGDI